MIPSSSSNLHLSSLPLHLPAPKLLVLTIPFIRAPKLHCYCKRRATSSWDSNAESFRARNFGGRDNDNKKKTRWWNDDNDYDDDEEDDFEEGDDFDPFEFDDGDESNVKQTIWDMFWILKVFKSFGYLLPAIIASFLLATGPKAFLMALALPLGQSVISLAIDKLWGKEPERPRANTRAKKPFTGYSGTYKRQWQDDDSYDDNGRPGYQTWVSPDAAVGSGQSRSSSSLGGWDELDANDNATNGYAGLKTSSQKDSAKSQPAKKGKLSKGGRYRDAPLFLRLLIAIFPFLGSWTKIL